MERRRKVSEEHWHGRALAAATMQRWLTGGGVVGSSLPVRLCLLSCALPSGFLCSASLPSILKLGLSTAFSVRGGRNIFVSQDFSHSITYCLDHCGHLAKPKHLFLCIVLRTQEEIDTCTVAAYRSGQAAPPPTFHALAVPDQRRVMPIYHVAVKFVPKTMPTNGAQ